MDNDRRADPAFSVTYGWLAVLVGLGIQSVTFVWFLATLAATVQQQGELIGALTTQHISFQHEAAVLAQRQQATESERRVRRQEIDRRLDWLENRASGRVMR